MNWIRELKDTVERHGAGVRVVVVRADGSTPREVGAGMIVTPDGVSGTIGGGALELVAIGEAKAMLVPTQPEAGGGRWARRLRDFPLGPSLGQCCGGRVRLLFERYAAEECIALCEADGGTVLLRPLVTGVPIMLACNRRFAGDVPLAVGRTVRAMLAGEQPRQTRLMAGHKGGLDWLIEPLMAEMVPLYLYGAGHVGRAVVRALMGLPFRITWIDTQAERFPEWQRPEAGGPRHHREVECLAVHPEAMPRLAAKAPAGTYHLVMTYSHALDLELCLAVLAGGGFGYLGLIGSHTKRARFADRLRQAGIAERALAELHCPIGLAGMTGKEPATIAISVAADLMLRVQRREPAAGVARGSIR
jgi:xanthine dehydrogenase accessory factor